MLLAYRGHPMDGGRVRSRPKMADQMANQMADQMANQTATGLEAAYLCPSASAWVESLVVTAPDLRKRGTGNWIRLALTVDFPGDLASTIRARGDPRLHRFPRARPVQSSRNRRSLSALALVETLVVTAKAAQETGYDLRSSSQPPTCPKAAQETGYDSRSR